MNLITVQARVDAALEAILLNDRHLLEYDVSERCLAARLSFYLQGVFPAYSVDVEYNRAGQDPKRLQIPEQCANATNDKGKALVVPDIIVHRRGKDGPNALVVEMKKTTNPDDLGCDRKRVQAMRIQLKYQFGVLIELETRSGHEPSTRCVEWFYDQASFAAANRNPWAHP